MINKIGFELNKRNYFTNNNKKEVIKSNVSNPMDCTKSPLGLNYFIPFLGDKNSSQKMSKLDTIMYYADTPAKNYITALKNEAMKTGYDKVTTLHVLKYGLEEVLNYINDLDEGKKDYNQEQIPPMAYVFENSISSNLFSNKTSRNAIIEPLENNIEFLNMVLEKVKPQKVDFSSSVTLSEDVVDAIWGVREDENAVINPFVIMAGIMNSPDDETYDIVGQLVFDISDAVMANETPLEKRSPFSAYEEKAKSVLKNLALGTNIYLTYDHQKETPENFLDTLQKVLQQSGNTKTILKELNGSVNGMYFEDLVNQLSKDKANDYIVAFNPCQLAVNSAVESDPREQLIIPKELLLTVQGAPSNVKFLFYDAKANYYNIMEPILGKFCSYEEVQIPTLSSQQMIKSFKENEVLKSCVKKELYSKEAFDKILENSLKLDGVFPTKTINLFNKIKNYYSDKDKINENDVDEYLKEASNLFKKVDNDSSIEVIFDTGKTLKDIIGKDSTKKEAATIVKQIKSNQMGTKGIVIYSQDGSPGSGRRFTAKAIAGEAQIPYVEVNTMDFGTKDVDLFGGGALSPEASIKKLFSLVSTQAEANPNKSAVLFIENFEYFSVGELVSYYHQKAMAQLLREMEKASKAGLNILVVGSVADPRLIGEATMKSFKFVDKVEVSSPAFNRNERAQIIAHALKDANIRVSDPKNVIKYVSDITAYSSFIELKNLVKKAQTVAMERGHKTLNKADFTEAFLQLTTGRPASNKIQEHEKLVVASHECGHATNLEVMNNVAKTLGKPWHIPQKVNFITLDPRGWYGGAVYHGKDINDEKGFENVFADIVCSFGGNSAENAFFDMDGSYGISSDMEHVRRSAEVMVKVMGLGAKTGKMSIGLYDDLSDKMKQMIEDDERVIINNAKLTSEMITNIYSDFNVWFTQKYAPLVGTGDCLIDGDEFRKALKEWRSSQSEEKQKELQLCDEAIVKIMEATKKGIAVRRA